MHAESDIGYQTDSQERPGSGKDATSTILSLKTPILHTMSTARSMSPLPGVHTFCKKTEDIANSRSPVSGEVHGDSEVIIYLDPLYYFVCLFVCYQLEITNIHIQHCP